MQTIVKWLLILLFLTFSSVAFSDSPESLTKQYYKYIKTNDWGKLTDMMHPDAVKALKDALIPMFEIEAAQNRKLVLEKVYGDGATLEQAKKASNTEFFKRSMKNISSMMRNANFKIDGTKVIGKVSEGNNKTHVLVRETMSVAKMDISYRKREKTPKYTEKQKQQI